MMHSEVQSYEDWMNDTATMGRSNAKGRHAKWQPRCDRCGQFVRPG